MAVGVQKAWSVTAASNASADTNINYAEGQTPASLNNSARADMAAVKGFANQILGAKTTGGAADAQTFTSDSVAAISTAYAAGMGFVFKAGYTNTGAATLNVDGVGAKSIKKGGAQSALVAGDIVAGGIYAVYYEASGDCFILLNPEKGQIAAGFQPLDATLTALAALSWASGNALVQFTAADTVSLTLAPSVTSITATTTSAGAPGITSKNTADAAAVQVSRLEGDRATPAASDTIYESWILSDSAGNQDEFARMSILGITVTSGAEDGMFRLSVRKAGVLTSVFDFWQSYFAPLIAGVSLGNTVQMWAGAYLASGGVINFNNGDVTITHASNALTFAGAASGYTFSEGVIAPPFDSTETGGTLTSASKNRRVVCASNPTLPSSGFASGDWILLDPGGTARTITRPAAHTMYVRDTDSATGTSYAHNIALAIYHGSSKWTLHGVTG